MSAASIARVPKRHLAVVRRIAILHGRTFDSLMQPSLADTAAQSGLFDLSAEKHRSRALRQPKGHKTDHTLAERVAKIQAGVAGLDKRIADHRKTVPAKPLKRGLLVYVKKNAWEKE